MELPLFVVSEQMDAEVFDQLSEDIDVMTHILGKTLRQALPNDYSGGERGPAPERLYVQGYGALFVTNVRFPLFAAEGPTDGEAEVEEPSVWEETRKELHGEPVKAGGMGGGGYQSTSSFGLGGAGMMTMGPGVVQRTEYNARKVRILENVVLNTLKLGANIRNLGPDESLVVVVKGMATDQVVARTAQYVDPIAAMMGSGSVGMPGPSRNGRNTVMTIAVKKSDVDAFAHGDITFEEFRDRASIYTY
jgi:hypothetical protein